MKGWTGSREGGMITIISNKVRRLWTEQSSLCPKCGGEMQLAKKGLGGDDNLLDLDRDQMNYCGECDYHVGDDNGK